MKRLKRKATTQRLRRAYPFLTHTRQALEAEEFLANREDTSAGGTSWERIGKLVDLSGKGSNGGASGTGKEKLLKQLIGRGQTLKSLLGYRYRFYEAFPPAVEKELLQPGPAYHGISQSFAPLFGIRLPKLPPGSFVKLTSISLLSSHRRAS